MIRKFHSHHLSIFAVQEINNLSDYISTYLHTDVVKIQKNTEKYSIRTFTSILRRGFLTKFRWNLKKIKFKIIWNISLGTVWYNDTKHIIFKSQKNDHSYRTTYSMYIKFYLRVRKYVRRYVHMLWKNSWKIGLFSPLFLLR